jgi:hypothetical protein
MSQANSIEDAIRQQPVRRPKTTAKPTKPRRK